MTYGNEPRRKRRPDSSRRDEADEADNLLAGLRGGGRGGEPDPFATPLDTPAPFEVPSAFDAPGRPATRDDEGPRGYPAGHADRPAGRRRAREDGEQPSGAFNRPTFDPQPYEPQPYEPPPYAAAPPERPPYAAVPPERPHQRPVHDRPVAEPAQPRAGRRRARDDGSERGTVPSYDHGPELTPIIKPLSAFPPPEVPTEPPPLVPIFPSIRPDRTTDRVQPPAAPMSPGAPLAPAGVPRDPSGERTPPTGRRARRALDDEISGERRPRLRTGDTGAPPVDGPRDRTGTGESRRDALRQEPPTRGRRAAYDDAPPPRRALDDDLPPRRARAAVTEPPLAPPPGRARPGGFEATPPPGRPIEEPTRRRGRGTGEYSGEMRRGTGEFTGEFTTGGTRRALRQPPGTAPARPGGPSRPTGSTRRPPIIDPVKPEHRPHRWIAALAVIGVLAVLAGCGMGVWFMIRDERNGPSDNRANASQGAPKRDISNRTVDPNPLTEAEVFPANNITAAPNEPPYVILKTQASKDCRAAATDDLAKLLVDAGCSEVVRATMKSPNEQYLITAGLFNLTSEQAAEQAFNGVKGVVDGQKGRFSGMSVGAGTGTDAIVRAPTQLGWNYKGHFIAYCVIARVDGKPFAADDAFPAQITFDIVETYLENGVIGARATVPPDPTPAASLSQTANG